jgi:hypothetical protein
MNKLWILACAAALNMAAQDIHNLIPFEALAEKAEEKVEVNLDGNILALAMRFLSDKKQDEAQVKRLLGNVRGIYVRSLEFKKPGQYSQADVDKVMQQLRGPQWQRVVDVKERGGDNAGVFMKANGDNVEGIVVVAAEPTELTIVNIVGNIRPEDLGAIGGKFGIPNMFFGNSGGKLKTKPRDKKKAEDE